MRQVLDLIHCRLVDILSGGTPEIFDALTRLIVGHFVSSFIDPRKAEVAILANLASLNFTWSPDKRCVAGSVELLGVGVVNLLANRFTSEPVADVV